MRNDPFTGLRRMHAGFDISAYPGEKVRATADGVVINTGMDVNYGRFIEIDHKNGYMTRYGHLSKVNINQSQPIKRGDIIGHVGNTGRASGYHLHYEVHRNGRVVNPSAYFFPEHTVVD
jgi:murein DD-endopeptidase MepM/ murein hydrolase activator NlpD